MGGGAQVAAWAARTPAAPAIVDESGAISYSELLTSFQLLASWLASAGATVGTCVALLMEHCADYIVAQLATSQTGAHHLAGQLEGATPMLCC